MRIGHNQGWMPKKGLMQAFLATLGLAGHALYQFTQ